MGKDGVGVSNEAVVDAVRNGRIICRPNGSYQFVGKHATVVLNKEGKIVTAWARGRNGFRAPSQGRVLGVIMTIVSGVEVAGEGITEMIRYRRRIQKNIDAIFDGNKGSDLEEGISF